MANKSHCYNLAPNEDVRNFLKKIEADFEAKFPEGGATAKKNYMLKQFKDQQTQAKQNLLDNSQAIKNMLERFKDSQASLEKQGFGKKPLSQFMKDFFFGTGKHYEDGGLSFYATTKAEENLRTGQYNSDLIKELGEQYYQVINMDFRSDSGRALNNDIRRELARINPREGQIIEPTGNELAMKIAKVIDKHNLKNLQDMEALEIPFAKRIMENGRKGYDGYQTHDPDKLRNPKTGEDEITARDNWVKFLKDKLIPAQAKLLDDPKQAETIFSKLLGKPTSKSANKDLLSFIKSTGDDLDTSIDLQRGLYFKTLDDSLEYNARYGRDEGVIFQADNQIRRFATEINSKRQLGANPYAVLNELNNLIQAEKGFGKKQTNKFNTDVLSTYYDVSIGKVNKSDVPWVQSIQKTLGNIRTLGGTTRYGSTAINTVGLDVALARFKQAEMNGAYFEYILKSPFYAIEGLARSLKAIGRANPFSEAKYGLKLNEQAFLADNAVGWNAISAEMQKYWQADITSKGVDKLSKTFSRAALLNSMKNLSDSAGLDIIAGNFGRNLGKGYNNLTPDFKTYLGKIGIKKQEWEVLQNIIPEINSNTKQKMVYPSSVRGLTDKQLEPLITKKTFEIQKKKQTELGALRELRRQDEDFKKARLEQNTTKIEEFEKLYNDKKKDIIDLYNKQERNVYSITRQELENKLATATYELNRQTQGEKTLRQKVFMGKEAGEGQKFFLALKTPIINQYQTTIESILFNPNLSKYGRYGTIIGFGAASVVVSSMAILQRDVLTGKEPRKIDADLFKEAFLYSNINTLYTELPNIMFGSLLGTSRNKEMSLTSDLIGFASPDIANLLKLYQGTAYNVGKAILTDEKFNTDFFIQSTKSVTPFQNLWATRALTDMTFDYISEFLGGQGLQKRRKGMNKQENIFGEQRKYIPGIEQARRAGE